MAYNLDQQFILKYTLLIREVLADEARYVSRNDQSLKNIHNYLFSRNISTPFAEIPEMDRQIFRKYFYENAGAGNPREEVPFSGSPLEQAAFFDSLRRQVGLCTYNFERMDFLRPSYGDEKATEPVFNQYQQNLLLKGVVYPLLHGLEQGQIAGLEQSAQSQPAGETQTGGQVNGNPYRGLGEKMLVQGLSGQFDTVLTYAQLEAIAGQEDLLRKQALPQEQIVLQLREFINKSYPGLQIYLTAEGKIVPFLRGVGVSATAMPAQAGAIGFAEALAEMKIRQGRTLQYEAIIASQGTLGLTPWNFQIVDSAGVVSAMDGLSMGLDQEGQGNRIVGFVADRQGVSAKLVADTGEYRVSGKVQLHFTIYQTPDKDSPDNPKLRLERTELPRLQLPLLALYQQLQEAGEFRVVPGRPFREPGTGAVKPPEKPAISKENPEEAVPVKPGQPDTFELVGDSAKPRLQAEKEGPAGATFTLPGKKVLNPQERLALRGDRPKLQPQKPAAEPAVPAQGEEAALEDSAMPPAPRPKKPAPETEGVGGLGIGAPPTSSNRRRVVIAAAATAGPLAGILGSALVKILIS